jgi:hypothetical protein
MGGVYVVLILTAWPIPKGRHNLAILNAHKAVNISESFPSLTKYVYMAMVGIQALVIQELIMQHFYVFSKDKISRTLVSLGAG